MYSLSDLFQKCWVINYFCLVIPCLVYFLSSFATHILFSYFIHFSLFISIFSNREIAWIEFFQMTTLPLVSYWYTTKRLHYHWSVTRRLSTKLLTSVKTFFIWKFVIMLNRDVLTTRINICHEPTISSELNGLNLHIMFCHSESPVVFLWQKTLCSSSIL